MIASVNHLTVDAQRQTQASDLGCILLSTRTYNLFKWQRLQVALQR